MSARPPRPARGPVISLDPEQRSRLLAAKLRTLVATAAGAGASGVDAAEPVTFAGTAAMVVEQVAWVLADERPTRSVGPALAWADQRGVRSVRLLVDAGEAAGVAARRASHFADGIEVLAVEGRELRAADASPFAERRVPTPAALELIGLLEGAGVEVTVEHGEIRGEVLGLEMARVVSDDDGTARVEVGVGRHDREAFSMLHGDVPAADALRAVIDAVRAHRRADAPAHPLNRLAGERWLRATLLADPGRVGARHLEPLEGTVERDSVKDVVPAVAAGEDDQGRPLVVACSVGIDLDLVPVAADARALHDPEARLIVVVPERDAHPVTRRLAARLARPAEVIGVPGDWRV